MLTRVLLLIVLFLAISCSTSIPTPMKSGDQVSPPFGCIVARGTNKDEPC